MKFSKDNQPKNRRKPSGNARVVMTFRVNKSTLEYFRSHNVKGGEVLDEYVEKEK